MSVRQVSFLSLVNGVFNPENLSFVSGFWRYHNPWVHSNLCLLLINNMSALWFAFLTSLCCESLSSLLSPGSRYYLATVQIKKTELCC